ncbi:MAG: ATP-binding protein [bacterium]|nr:ATP-binding protein [bacterium]
MADSEILARVKTAFEEKRSRADSEKRRRIRSVYDKYPKIEEIENEFSRLGMENVRRIAAEPDKAAEYNAELKQKFNELEAMKSELLKDYGIPENYREPRYECGICSDTGYKPNGKRCCCFEQAIIDEAFGSTEHIALLEKEKFRAFRLDYYPDENENGKNPREAAKNAAGRAKKLCDNFDNETKGLIFIGNPGLGKSFLSNCVEGALRRQGKTVLSVRAVKLFRLMEDYKFGREEDDEKLYYVYNADLLIIDDLGTENDNQMNSSFFDEILNERIHLGKKTVISTNYSLEELQKKYSTRFISRLAEYFIISVLYGEDIRYQKVM